MTYEDYYLNQVGSGLSVFSGVRRQRGHGFFGSILRAAAPLLKQGAKRLGRHVLETGVNVAGDLMSGVPVRRAVKRRVMQKIRSGGVKRIKPTVQRKRRIRRRAPVKKGSYNDIFVKK